MDGSSLLRRKLQPVGWCNPQGNSSRTTAVAADHHVPAHGEDADQRGASGDIRRTRVVDDSGSSCAMARQRERHHGAPSTICKYDLRREEPGVHHERSERFVRFADAMNQIDELERASTMKA